MSKSGQQAGRQTDRQALLEYLSPNPSARVRTSRREELRGERSGMLVECCGLQGRTKRGVILKRKIET
jgi:hypothetical protein